MLLIILQAAPAERAVTTKVIPNFEIYLSGIANLRCSVGKGRGKTSHLIYLALSKKSRQQQPQNQQRRLRLR